MKVLTKHLVKIVYRNKNRDLANKATTVKNLAL